MTYVYLGYGVTLLAIGVYAGWVLRRLAAVRRSAGVIPPLAGQDMAGHELAEQDRAQQDRDRVL